MYKLIETILNKSNNQKLPFQAPQESCPRIRLWAFQLQTWWQHDSSSPESKKKHHVTFSFNGALSTESRYLSSRTVADNWAYYEAKTKATTVANQNKSKQHNEPMRTQRKYVQSQARENASDQLVIYFGIASHWSNAVGGVKFLNQSL